MPRCFGSPALAPSGDGRLELFVFGLEDQSLWHITQTAWSNGWSNWALHGSLGSDSVWPPVLDSSGDGRLELFVSGNSLRHKWQTAWSNGWSSWASHGSPPAPGSVGMTAPDLERDAGGRLQLFVSQGGQLWRLEQVVWSGVWSGWLPHGNPPGVLVTGPPCVARNADGRLEAFVLSSSGEMWHIWQTSLAGAWSAWASLGTAGGGFEDHPAAIRSADGRMELFVRGRDGALWQRWQTAASNGWSEWHSHGARGGGFVDHPAVAASADGRLELFIVGLDGNLWHKWQTAASNGWSDWVSHGNGGEIFSTGPVVAASGDRRLELFATSASGNLWHQWQTAASNGWSGWASHGHP